MQTRETRQTDWYEVNGYFYKPGNPTPHYRNRCIYKKVIRNNRLVNLERYVYTPAVKRMPRPKYNHELKKEVLQRIQKYRVCDPKLIPVYEEIKRVLDKYETDRDEGGDRDTDNEREDENETTEREDETTELEFY